MKLDLQIASAADIPSKSDFSRWSKAALKHLNKDGTICIRIVDEAEITALNEKFRKKKGPTNILSFPADLPAEIADSFLGDIVICAPIVNNGPISWAHIVIHGILHLLGCDHETESEANTMENIEQQILTELGTD